MSTSFVYLRPPTHLPLRCVRPRQSYLHLSWIIQSHTLDMRQTLSRQLHASLAAALRAVLQRQRFCAVPPSDWCKGLFSSHCTQKGSPEEVRLLLLWQDFFFHAAAVAAAAAYFGGFVFFLLALDLSSCSSWIDFSQKMYIISWALCH